MRKYMLMSALAVTALTLAPAAVTAQDVLGYDAVTGASATFTSSMPRTFMGQAFSVADPGPMQPVLVRSMRIGLVVGGAASYQNTQIRVQFWDTYNSAATGTAPAFSDPVGGLRTFTTGPINVAGATIFTFTLPFAVPIPLTGLTNHAFAVNWQSDPGGTGTFATDSNLTAGLRAAGSAAINPGANATVGGQYFRNASSETDFNFQANSVRSLGNANGGLIFSLTLVPEPGTLALLGIGGLIAARRHRRA